MTGDSEAAIATSVRERWEEWFPGRPAPLSDRPSLLAARPGARLYVVRAGGPGQPAGLLAKVRTADPPGPGRFRNGSTRPTLTADPVDAAEATSREYRGLASIQSAFAEPNTEFRSVRPLSLLQEHNMIMMDFLEGRSLRDRLVAGSRFFPDGGAPFRDDPEAPWHRVGAWLRRYQAGTPTSGLTPRHTTRRQVVDQFHAYDEFLSSRLGEQTFARLGRRGAELAEAALPPQLEVAVGHHDFAPRNVLLGHDGRVSVIDPLWRWAAPAMEDLCRFVVGMRLLGLQVHTHGLAIDQGRLRGLQDAVIAGYYGETVPWARLRCYESLILLDKWAALVARTDRRGVRSRALGMSLRLATGYIAREVRQVLDDGEKG